MLRQLRLLQLIPRQPRKITAAELRAKLESQGERVSLRSVQRDLLELERQSMFGLQGDNGSQTGWWIKRDAPQLQFPQLDVDTALTFCMAEQHLEHLLPQSMMTTLGPWFAAALAVVRNTDGGLRWLDRVRVVPASPFRRAPQVDARVRESVHKALLNGQQLRLMYRALGAASVKEYIAHPLGLVARDRITYLVFAKDGSPGELREFPLHRMQSAEVIDAPSQDPEGFVLDEWLEGNSGFACGGAIDLVLDVSERVASYLQESPIAEPQHLSPRADGWVRVEVRINDSLQLRSWLLSLGADVVVVGPEGVREFVAGEVREMVLGLHLEI